MMTNMVWPVYAANDNSESKLPSKFEVCCIRSIAAQNMFLNIKDGSTKDNAKIQMAKKNYSNGTLNQQFYLWRDSNDGYYTIIPMHTISWGRYSSKPIWSDISFTKCIGVENDDDGVGAEVKQRYFSFDDSCKWAIKDVGNGQYEFTLKSSGLKLNVDGGSDEESTRLQLDNGNGQACQKFQFENKSDDYVGLLSLQLNNMRFNRVLELNQNKITLEDTFKYRYMDKVEINPSVEEIDQKVFNNWSILRVCCRLKWLKRFDQSKLETIEILSDSSEKDVVNITKEDLDKCSNLRSLNIFFKNFDEKMPLSEKLKIEDGALDNCKNIESLNIYSEVKDDSNGYEKKLKVTNSKYVKRVSLSFKDGNGLKKATVDPKWLNELPKSQIETLVVPKWVLEVHEKDFEGCNNLKELIFENDDTKLCGENCDVLEYIESAKCSAKTALSMRENLKGTLKKLEIKEGTTSIESELRSFLNLEEIKLPKTLKSIDGRIFADCNNLKSVTVDPKWLNKLPKSQIETLIVPKWVSEVQEEDFEGCYNLRELIFEDILTKLCGKICDALEHLESIKCDEDLAASMSKNLKKNVKKLELIEGAHEILDQLNGFDNLEKIDLNEDLLDIGKDAFKQNKKLEEVCCKLKFLKDLPKDQIKTIRLKDENIDIDQVMKDELKEYTNLESVIFKKDGEMVAYSIGTNNIKYSNKAESLIDEISFIKELAELINNEPYAEAESINNELCEEEQEIDGIKYKLVGDNESKPKRFKLNGSKPYPLENVIISSDMVNYGLPFEIGDGIQSITLQGDEEIIFGVESNVRSINANKSTRYISDEIGLYHKNQDGSKGKTECIFNRDGEFDGVNFSIDTDSENTEVKNINVCDYLNSNRDVRLPEYLTQFNVPIKIGVGIESLILENDDIVDLSSAISLTSVNANKSTRYISDEIGLYRKNKDGSKGRIERILHKSGKFDGLKFFIDTNYEKDMVNEIKIFDYGNIHKNVKLPEFLTHFNIPIKIGTGIESLILENDDLVDLSEACELKSVNITNSNKFMVENGVLYEKDKYGKKGNKVIVNNKIRIIDLNAEY